MVVSDGRSVLADPNQGGDEPVLMALKLPGVPVVAGKNRYRAARDAQRRFDPDIVILDDGFQHLHLTRTLDIVLVDARDPFGNGKLFPAGILREPISALERAHVVLITNADRTEDADALKRIVRQNTNARIFTSRQTPLDLIECRSGVTRPLSALREATVFGFSGIARPESFIALLRSLGAIIAGEQAYPDHYDFTRSDLASVYKSAADEKAAMIVTTEKDAVRLNRFKPEGIWALRIELSVFEHETWEEFLLKSL